MHIKTSLHLFAHVICREYVNKVTFAIISSSFCQRLGKSQKKNVPRKHPNPSLEFFCGLPCLTSRDLGSHQVISCRQEDEDRCHSDELGGIFHQVSWHGFFLRIYGGKIEKATQVFKRMDGSGNFQPVFPL